jgi:hypothetical protein
MKAWTGLKQAPPPERMPIFVLGVSPRSGTNWVQDLLVRHPACQAFPVFEDAWMAPSNLLMSYAQSVSGFVEYRYRLSVEGSLLQALGTGLLHFAAQQTPGRRAVLKTPYSEGIHNFSRLFPDGRAVVVLRDGRDAVESMMRMEWNLPFTRCVEIWRRGAERVHRFVQAHGTRGRNHAVIRYEDLFNRPKPTISAMLKFADLPLKGYPMKAAMCLPVRGSSFHFSDPETRFTQPLPRTPEFNPIGRWKAWPTSRLRAFERAAGRQMRDLGYSLELTS